ncbi:hypothetical protein DL98DRAFT_599375 [Cadophora sp. DSE1049]|nr:hypothetical protein DL98DRAFT_599375 [Cadophora sp. DSE1049]
MKARLDIYDFKACLASIGTSSASITEWAKTYYETASEQGSHMVPNSITPLHDCHQMIGTQERLLGNLYRIRQTVERHQYAVADQRSQDHGSKGLGEFDDDMKTQNYHGSEVRKRRRGAAPLGRCHRCNKADTPEWRRGPDGARKWLVFYIEDGNP